MKVYKKDLDKIKDLSLLILYRKTLQYLKTYPSITRDEIKKASILEFREKKLLTDKEEIKNAITIGRQGLAHLMLMEMKRQEIISDDHEISQTVSLDKGEMKEELMNPNKKKKDDEYVYF